MSGSHCPASVRRAAASLQARPPLVVVLAATACSVDGPLVVLEVRVQVGEAQGRVDGRQLGGREGRER